VKIIRKKLSGGEYQKIWVTSDFHLNHKRILEFEPNKRPFNSVEEMAEDYIDKHNNLVGVDDYWIHLGDFCFGNHKIEDTASYLSRMKGNKIMLYGNHDFPWTKEQIGAFWVGHYMELRTQVLRKNGQMKKATFVLFHYPIAQWNGKQKGVPCIFGHSHGSFDYHKAGLENQRIMDADIGSNAGCPYNLDDLHEYFMTIDYKKHHLDHHNEETT
jgi:calcineurin-like phosphoesterase family protein